jgi:hypothetical protein
VLQRNNKVGDTGAAALGNGLKVNSNLWELDLVSFFCRKFLFGCNASKERERSWLHSLFRLREITELETSELLRWQKR